MHVFCVLSVCWLLLFIVIFIFKESERLPSSKEIPSSIDWIDGSLGFSLDCIFWSKEWRKIKGILNRINWSKRIKKKKKRISNFLFVRQLQWPLVRFFIYLETQYSVTLKMNRMTREALLCLVQTIIIQHALASWSDLRRLCLMNVYSDFYHATWG